MKKLKEDLKNLLKKEKFLVDIILFGSSLKGKDLPNDIDVILIFRGKNYQLVDDIINKARKINENLHVEPIIIDFIYNQDVSPYLLHEGFSIRNMKFIRDLIKFRSYIMATYSLKNMKQSDKVRFSYALYGREKNQGFLNEIKGKEIGKGSILVPVEKQDLLKKFFEQWRIEYKEQRVSIFE